MRMPVTYLNCWRWRSLFSSLPAHGTRQLLVGSMTGLQKFQSLGGKNCMKFTSLTSLSSVIPNQQIYYLTNLKEALIALTLNGFSVNASWNSFQTASCQKQFKISLVCYAIMAYWFASQSKIPHLAPYNL